MTSRHPQHGKPWLRRLPAYPPRIKLFKHEKDIGSLVQRVGLTKLGQTSVGAITATKYGPVAVAYGIPRIGPGRLSRRWSELAILGVAVAYAARIGVRQGGQGRIQRRSIPPHSARSVSVQPRT